MRQWISVLCAWALLASGAAAAPAGVAPYNWLMPPLIPGTPPGLMHYLTGNSLLERCESESVGCSLYIDGVVDAQGMMVAGTNRTVPYCIPGDSSARQVMHVVIGYLRTHPADRHKDAAYLVTRALSEAWPQCHP